MKNRMNLSSFLRILGMSLGISVVHQLAPMLAHQVEAENSGGFHAQSSRRREYSARSTLSPFEG